MCCKFMSCLDRERRMEMDAIGDCASLPTVVRIHGQEVKDFSSQYGAEDRKSYAAENLAGDYSIYPKYGDYTQACVFRTYGPWWRMVPSAPKPFCRTPTPNNLNSEDFIEVFFGESLYPVAVHIYETYNPGAIVRILGCDYQGGTNVDTGRPSKWMTLWSKPVADVPRRVRIFSPPIKRIDTPINVVRLELNHSLMHYYTELDCILLCGVRNKPAARVYAALQAHADQPLGVQPEQSAEQTYDDCKTNAPMKGVTGDEVSLQFESLHIHSEDQHSNNKNLQLFERLPGEIIVMILGYLDFPSLGKVAQTCRLLQSHAYDHFLYTELNLQPVWDVVCGQTLMGLASRCETLQRLNLSWCGQGSPVNSEPFLQLLQSCKGTLQSLQLSCSSYVTDSTLSYIATNCVHLKELDISGCLQVNKCSASSLMKMTNLECLNLYRTKLDTYTVVHIVRCMPKLKHLNLGSCKLISNAADVLTALGAECQDLRSLDLWRAHNVDDMSFQSFIQCCPLLEELDLGWCTDLCSRANSFKLIAETCKNLKKLFLTANRTVCDVDLLSLAKHSHHLQQLDILGTREVSSEAVEKVLIECTELVMIDVSFCSGITEREVSMWQQKYPHVNIKRSFQDS